MATTAKHWKRDVIDYATGRKLSGGASEALAELSDQSVMDGGNGCVRALMEAGLWVPVSAVGDPRGVTVWVDDPPGYLP